MAKSLVAQGSHHMAADEASSPRHQDEIIFLHQCFRHAVNVPEKLDFRGAALDRRTGIGNLSRRISITAVRGRIVTRNDLRPWWATRTRSPKFQHVGEGFRP